MRTRRKRAAMGVDGERWEKVKRGQQLGHQLRAARARRATMDELVPALVATREPCASSPGGGSAGCGGAHA